MEAIQQKMAEGKKSERTDALKKLRSFTKGLVLQLACSRAHWLQAGLRNNEGNT